MIDFWKKKNIYEKIRSDILKNLVSNNRQQHSNKHFVSWRDHLTHTFLSKTTSWTTNQESTDKVVRSFWGQKSLPRLVNDSGAWRNEKLGGFIVRIENNTREENSKDDIYGKKN